MANEEAEGRVWEGTVNAEGSMGRRVRDEK